VIFLINIFVQYTGGLSGLDSPFGGGIGDSIGGNVWGLSSITASGGGGGGEGTSVSGSPNSAQLQQQQQQHQNTNSSLLDSLDAADLNLGSMGLFGSTGALGGGTDGAGLLNSPTPSSPSTAAGAWGVAPTFGEAAAPVCVCFLLHCMTKYLIIFNMNLICV